MSKYYMGIDNGGTMCKAVIFNQDGQEVASSSKKLELLTPENGFTERDMDDLWQTNTEVISDVVKRADIDPKTIAGVACTGHGKGLYLWGKDGRPCCNGIVSTDSRAWKYPEKWENDGTADKVFAKTFQKILACQPVSLLCWFKENKPEIIPEIKWIFEVKDYIRFRLTGEAYAEITDYSGSNLLNLKTKKFDRELLALYGLEDLHEALPPIKGSTDLCGHITAEAAALTGLAEKTPVAGGMFDIDACAIAMDITNDENICVIAGTWSINEYISKQPVLNRSIMMNSIYCLDEYYLIEECSPTSAGNLEWYIDMFLDEEKKRADAQKKNIYEYCNSLVKKIDIEEQDIIFLPYIFGSNYNAKARACFIGMDSRHERAHMVRAVFEGIVFCHMVHLEKLLQNRTETKAIRLAGGAAKSQTWAQMFSDVSGLPVEIIETDELGTLGCAMAAAVAAGYYPTLAGAAEKMVKVKERLVPDMQKHSIYKEKLKRYKQVSEALDGTW
jgi:L-xylulokinase